MTAIACHVAIISNDKDFREHWCAQLNSCALNQKNDLNISFIASSYDQSVSLASDDGLLQAVIIDAAAIEQAQQLALKLKKLRVELSQFLTVVDAGPIDDSFDELFARDEHNFNNVYRLVQAALQKRASTPFADALREYIYSAKDSWHTPGHAGGDSLRSSPWVSDFYALMGEHVFNADLSCSVQSLDSLMDPQSVMQEAQKLAAKTFGAKHTFFVTNGTSTANKVVVQQLLGGGGKILLDRGSHKSMHHAVIMFGIEPIYLNPSLQPEYGVYGPVCRDDILAAINAHPDAKLLVLTSCTYDGLYYDLAPIIEAAHAQHIKVLIDEAWYAHGRFHPALRPNALDCGADYVTQSTHKMLSAFSQASMVHVADPDFDEHRFQENINMHTSTSPQYSMIASLDVARKQMSMEGYQQLSRCLAMAKRLRTEINQTQVFRVLELEDLLAPEVRADNIRLDPTKVTINTSASGYSGKQLQQLLFEQYGIQVEKTTHNTVSVLVTLGSTDSKVLRLIHALQQMASNAKAPSNNTKVIPLPAMSELKCLPKDAYFGATEDLPLLAESQQVNPSLIGRISADELVPYPPGIPLLVPGQVISQGIADYLLQLIKGKHVTEVHGLVYMDEEAMLRLVRK
ncbi:aminotransferase class V-fold PLP-dependent enzyme [Dasania sp. GY-MA-18]|uniref:Aminotransferase class V-fold PLP-dependent enzyme n=1 Tax=Dasania phycosphaerae TaxID=2950436 RepID=A0A9J6RP97_9GAMM|nr:MULTISPECIES: aminotransferase class I/II-fold pyridoxal phosphate-dependent enzyme [Dasania]MCR8923412.1 aminotransferase class V-fold PLP-dependent enzyme [Dasania sp. GY-MA-18]MCZ0865845.1 aminotransferase class V-fold PLP-dependent enzyme [Dasania phycosphaerae]MCZ0869569.1 aminotransferase class V-fold PLP-dependent enzyme [Dasania phycosphaerae]